MPVSSPRTICLLSAEHGPQDKRVFEKEGVSLARAGFRVVHLCPDDKPGQETVRGVELVTYRRQRGKLRRLLGLVGLFGRARRLNADAYHCNEPDSWAVGVLLRLVCGKVVVFDCHEHYPGQVKRSLPRGLRTVGAWLLGYTLQILGLMTHLIVLAKYSIEDDFSWTRKKHLVVLNTTPLEALEKNLRGQTPETMRSQSGPFTFVHIGVIRKERGSEELLDAIHFLSKRKPGSFRVVIIGEFKDGSEQEFFDRATEYGVRDCIDFHRWMPFADAFALVMRAHAGLILFQKSIENNVRGMPHKMFDYMLAGLPVIAPDFAPDIVSVLRESNAGLLIDTADPEAIAGAMLRLIENPGHAREIGDRGRRAVYEKYHWERDAEKLIAAYHGLLGTEASAPSQTAGMRKAA